MLGWEPLTCSKAPSGRCARRTSIPYNSPSLEEIQNKHELQVVNIITNYSLLMYTLQWPFQTFLISFILYVHLLKFSVGEFTDFVSPPFFSRLILFRFPSLAWIFLYPGNSSHKLTFPRSLVPLIGCQDVFSLFLNPLCSFLALLCYSVYCSLISYVQKLLWNKKNVYEKRRVHGVHISLLKDNQ